MMDYQAAITEKAEKCFTYYLDLNCLQYAKDQFEVDVYLDKMTDTAVLKIISQLNEQVVEEICYPFDWWEAFKERWFPKWLLAKFPVVYKKITAHKRVITSPVLSNGHF